MGKWKWEGLGKDGKNARGEIDAGSQREARKLLRIQGIRAKRITAPSFLELDLGEVLADWGLATPVSNKELTHFTKQLSIMINAGVPILQSLEILYKGQVNPSLKKSIKVVASDVGEGKTIAEALSRQKIFSKLYCNLVKAGEVGGILDEILKKLADHMDRVEKTKAQIKSAMTYPAIVVFVGTLVITCLMVFVVPQFQDMLTSTGKEMPFITQLVIDTSDFFQSNILIIIFTFIGLGVGTASFIKTNEGKIIFDNLLIRAPLFKNIIIKGNLASFSRTLSTMLSSGVSLVDSLEICIETIDNSVIAKDLKIVKEQVVRGKSLTEPLMKIKYFPEMVGQMMKVGENTGNIDHMLEKVSDVFEEEVGAVIETTTKLIEPLILLFLGGAVATVMVAMYLPMFMSAGG